MFIACLSRIKSNFFGRTVWYKNENVECYASKKMKEICCEATTKAEKMQAYVFEVNVRKKAKSLSTKMKRKYAKEMQLHNFNRISRTATVATRIRSPTQKMQQKTWINILRNFILLQSWFEHWMIFANGCGSSCLPSFIYNIIRGVAFDGLPFSTMQWMRKKLKYGNNWRTSEKNYIYIFCTHWGWIKVSKRKKERKSTATSHSTKD